MRSARVCWADFVKRQHHRTTLDEQQRTIIETAIAAQDLPTRIYAPDVRTPLSLLRDVIEMQSKQALCLAGDLLQPFRSAA